MRIKKKKEGIFEPTGTTKLLYGQICKIVKNKNLILDLGCGSGAIGFQTAKDFKKEIFMSDISYNAISLAKKKAKEFKIKADIRLGSLFDCWNDKKFDLIICDVAGVSEKISSYTPWYKNRVPNGSGDDGTKNIIGVLESAKKYLNKNGVLLVAIISLSNHKKILKKANSNFKIVKLIDKSNWPLPKELYKYKNKLSILKNKKLIDYIIKFNMIIYWTEIYLIKNPR
jgi:methylase of polypeptide subunit release factors